MTSYSSRAVKGASIVLFHSALASLIAYFIRIILARSLTPAEYGLFYSVFTLVIFFLFFRDLGLGSAMVKYISEWRVMGKFDEIKTAIATVFITQLGSSLIIATIFFFLSDYLSEHYFKNPQSAVILKILLFYLLFSILFILTKQIFQGFQRMFLYASVEPMKNAVVLILTIFFLKMGLSSSAPAFAFAFVGVILFVLYLPFLWKITDFRKHRTLPITPILKKLLSFGIPVLVTDVGAQIIGYIDTLILTHYRTLTEVGIYNVVLPSALMLVFLGKALSSVMFPLVSELWVKNDWRRLEQGISLIYKYPLIFLIPIISTGIVFSEFFIRFFFGENYVAGSMSLKILLAGVSMNIISSANHTLISGIGKPKVATVIILIAAAINAGLNFLFIPTYGIEGAAFSTMLSYFFVAIASTYWLVKNLRIRSPFKEWGILVIPAILFYITQYAIAKILFINPWTEIIISTMPALIVYYLLVAKVLKLATLSEIVHHLQKILKDGNHN